MNVPSCVSFRDQDYFLDMKKQRYGNWTRLETYCHLVAAKKAMRASTDPFEEVLTDGLKIAKELYRRGIIYKSSVDNCDPAQFAEIPDFKLGKNAFFSPMYRSIDGNFEHWFMFLEVLRLFPECRAATDEMESLYKQNLKDLEIEKYQGEITPVSSEEAKVLFDGICVELDNLWARARSLMDPLDNEKIKNNLRLCYVDKTREIEHICDREQMFNLMQRRLDIMNVNTFDTMMVGSDYMEFQEALRGYQQYRALISSRIRIKDFAHQLKTNRLFRPIVFAGEPTMNIRVRWDENETMFRFFWMMEIVFVSLSRHQYFHHVDIESNSPFSFWFFLPDWMNYAMLSMSRERAYEMIAEGACRVSVQDQITVLDPEWNISNKDQYDFMETVIKITDGRVQSVDEMLQGLKQFRRWEFDDLDKRIESMFDFVDQWSASVPVPPITIPMTGFMSLYETNHIWISHPFYSRRKGFKFCLIVYPRGISQGLNAHLSLGVCLMRGETDQRLIFPVGGKLTLRLLNQTGDRNHIQHTFKFDDNTRPEARERVTDCNDFARIATSVNQFVPLAQLDYNAETGTQYLVDDTLYFQIMHSDFLHRRTIFGTF